MCALEGALAKEESVGKDIISPDSGKITDWLQRKRFPCARGYGDGRRLLRAGPRTFMIGTPDGSGCEG